MQGVHADAPAEKKQHQSRGMAKARQDLGKDSLLLRWVQLEAKHGASLVAQGASGRVCDPYHTPLQYHKALQSICNWDSDK